MCVCSLVYCVWRSAWYMYIHCVCTLHAERDTPHFGIQVPAPQLSSIEIGSAPSNCPEINVGLCTPSNCPVINVGLCTPSKCLRN